MMLQSAAPDADGTTFEADYPVRYPTLFQARGTHRSRPGIQHSAIISAI